MSAVHHAFELATGPILTVVGAEPQATMVPGPAARAAFRPPEAARASLSARMVERALDLRGSPWVHMGRDAGLGLDHVGFVRDCLRHATGQEPADVLGYRAGWEDGLSMIAAGALTDDWGLEPVDLGAIAPGDVLLFSMPTAHLAVVTRDGPTPLLMHAYWAHAVTESWLGDYWRERLVAAFRLGAA